MFAVQFSFATKGPTGLNASSKPAGSICVVIFVIQALFVRTWLTEFKLMFSRMFPKQVKLTKIGKEMKSDQVSTLYVQIWPLNPN